MTKILYKTERAGKKSEGDSRQGYTEFTLDWWPSLVVTRFIATTVRVLEM